MKYDSLRLVAVQCNACGQEGKGHVRSMPLSGISKELIWVCPPRNWFVTQCLVENLEHEGGVVEGFSSAAFLICEFCAKLGRSEMGEQN